MENARPIPSMLSNRYQIQHPLGTGGMAVVYQAKDLMLERPVAIKLLRQDYSNHPAFREHFRQEARAVANLSHPNIVTVHDFGLDNGWLFLVMEYVPGANLKSILRQRGRLEILEAVSLLVQACAGVGYAHRAGLIHCDIKPHNMLVTPDQRLKVTDFGIARALASIQPDEKHDVVWGSPAYLSPEQAAGQAPSPASDVYSLGVVLYEALTGQLPFQSADPAELIRLHRDAQPVPPARLNPQIPQPLEQIVLKILSKEPSARYRTADQMGRVLEAIGQQLQTTQTNLRPEVPSASPHPMPASTPVPSRPTPASAPIPSQPVQIAPQEENALLPSIDWLSILLGLLALLAVGGLIPFWLYVWLSLNSVS